MSDKKLHEFFSSFILSITTLFSIFDYNWSIDLVLLIQFHCQGVALCLTGVVGIIGNLLTCIVLHRISLDNVFNQVSLWKFFKCKASYNRYSMKNLSSIIYQWTLFLNSSLLHFRPSTQFLRPFVLLSILWEKDLNGLHGPHSIWQFGQRLSFRCKI